MAGGREEVAAVLRRHRVFVSRDHPALARTARRMENDGLLVGLGRGVLVAAADVDQPEVRILAAAQSFPGAVVTGAAAARLTFWPNVPVEVITLSGGRTKATGPAVRLRRETIPAELTLQRWGIAVTTPALTALDLLGPGIDQALLCRAATLADMHEALALTPRRVGNRERRRLLHDSRDEPWSEAERLAHAILRAAGIRRFKTNWRVRCGSEEFDLDVAFPGVKVAIEIDGFEWHSSRSQFERDRRKHTMVTAAGWRVLHVTWHQLVNEPEWVIAQLELTLRLGA